MENLMTLKAESRQEVGKKIARKLRKEGRIPAIIYGEHKESIPISLLKSDVKAILKSETGGNTVLRIKRDNIQVDAMLKDIQYDYLSDNILHVDLIRVDLNQSVNVSVPVVTTGEPIGVKVEGGIFDFITRKIKIKCLATKIPKEFKIDITDLHAGHSIKIEDIEVEEGIKILSDSHTTICAVTAKGAAEEVIEEAEEEEEGEAPKEKPEETEDKDKEKDKDKK
jgi:large subunit ribosomal protein L25